MLKFGLIGCGRIGSMHADILHHENDVMLDSVFDLNTNLAKAVSKKTGAKICNHVFELFDNNNLDAVLIASATAISSTKPPLAQFTKIEPFFIL